MSEEISSTGRRRRSDRHKAGEFPVAEASGAAESPVRQPSNPPASPYAQAPSGAVSPHSAYLSGSQPPVPQMTWRSGALPPIQQPMYHSGQVPYPPEGYAPPRQGYDYSAYQQGYGSGQMIPPQGYGYSAPQPGYGSGQMPLQGYGTQPSYDAAQMGYDPASGTARGGPGGSRRQPHGHRKIPRAVIAAVIALAVLGAGFGGYMLYQDLSQRSRIAAAVAPYNARFCEGVYVDGIHLGGMTQDEARLAVNDHVNSTSGSWYANLVFEGQTCATIRASQMGVQVDVEKALYDAWQQGHVGDDATRYAEMERLSVTPYEGYSVTSTGDTSQLDSILSLVAQNLYSPPVDAVFLSFNPELTYPFTFQDEVAGRMLYTEPVRAALVQRLAEGESGDLPLTTDAIQPTVTVAQLKTRYATLRGEGYTVISTTSTEERNNNIRRAFNSINGTVLQPGQEFSFNGIVGERTIKNGFYEAIEYAYSEPSLGVGGGVCQASSTVYLAAFRAGLNITEREPHSDAVNYTDYGKDATVYWYSNHKIDLKFKNNTSSPIYIQAAVQSSQKSRSRLACYVWIYGESLGDVTYDIVTLEEEIPAPTEVEYVKDKKGEYVTYADQEYVYREASKGATVYSYRVKYVDGVEVSREYMYTDVYKAKAKRVYYGVKTR